MTGPDPRAHQPAGSSPTDLWRGGEPTRPGSPLDLTDLARHLHVQNSPQQVMDVVVDSAATLIEGVEHASISLILRGEVTSAAASSPTARAFDSLQAELDEGPCLDAMRAEAVVQVEDLTADTRWPALSRRAPQELEVRSTLCFQLFIADGAMGGLNLLAGRPNAFDDRALALGEVFAAHAAIALAAAQKVDHLTVALNTRDVIGQAKGILMERHKLTPEEAFAVLAKASQDRNVKLNVLAEQLTRSGSLED